jgi:PLP dependent protein
MIADNLRKVKSGLPSHVILVAVSKTVPVDALMQAYEAGQRIFGENKVQELISKYQAMPKDIEWHMIGHLQSNKFKFIVPFISLIHSVDSTKILEIIDKEAKKCGRIINCLLQVHIATEESKFGFDEEELEVMLKSDSFKLLQNVKICGLMGMATFTDDNLKIKKEFQRLAEISSSLKLKYFNQNNSFKELSMGMSSDCRIAIEAGSTMVRMGTSIFGNRV